MCRLLRHVKLNSTEAPHKWTIDLGWSRKWNINFKLLSKVQARFGGLGRRVRKGIAEVGYSASLNL